MSTVRRPALSPSLAAALDELAGTAVMVLDDELRITAASAAAEALLEESIPLGALAPKVLCGSSVERPIAEALSRGEAVTGTVERARRHLIVRASPMREGRKLVGWVLLLDDAGETEGEELFHGMWSADRATKRMFRLIEKVARSDATVLARGETGSGKELVARAIHDLSARASGPFRAINCAAVPPNLLESELFGHVRGAFTGAVRDTPGQFRLADKGTLFLDEVAELPIELQAKLLRVLETKTVAAVGGRDPVPVEVRIVAATHRPLRKEVEAGRFRADLMYRLRVIPIFIPPLRDRGSDAVLIAEKTLPELNARGGRVIDRIAPSAERAIERYHWPGNVRELRNALEYAYAIGEGNVLIASDLPPEIAAPERTVDGAPIVANVAPAVPTTNGPDAAAILRALERAAGSRARAARMLGISRVTLWRRMRDLGLAEGREPS